MVVANLKNLRTRRTTMYDLTSELTNSEVTGMLIEYIVIFLYAPYILHYIVSLTINWVNFKIRTNTLFHTPSNNCIKWVEEKEKFALIVCSLPKDERIHFKDFINKEFIRYDQKIADAS